MPSVAPLVKRDERPAEAEINLVGVAADVLDWHRREELVGLRCFGPNRLGDREAVDVGRHAADVGVVEAVEHVDAGWGVSERIVDVRCLGHAGLRTELGDRLGSDVVDVAVDRGLVDRA